MIRTKVDAVAVARVLLGVGGGDISDVHVLNAVQKNLNILVGALSGALERGEVSGIDDEVTLLIESRDLLQLLVPRDGEGDATALPTQ